MESLKTLWHENLKMLKVILINHRSAQCSLASIYADNVIVFVRGFIRDLSDNDPRNALTSLRPVLESMVKFKNLLVDASFVDKILSDCCDRENKLVKRANGTDGIGLETLKGTPLSYASEECKELPKFKTLCQQIGWLRYYNTLYCLTSEYLHVSSSEVLKCIDMGNGEIRELMPIGGSDHENDYVLAIDFGKLLGNEFSILLQEFEKLNLL